MSRLARVLAIAMVLVGTEGCHAAPQGLSITDEAAARGFVIAPGQTATLRGGAISFLGVARDGRCRNGGECAESGPVTARLRVDAGPEIELSILDRDRGEPDFQGIRSCVAFAGRTLRLRDVTPWPAGAMQVRPEDYRVELIVAEGCSPGRKN